MRFWSAVIMLFVTTSVFALSTEKLKTEVDTVELKKKLSLYKTYKGFRAQFTQTKYIKSMNVSLKSKGNLSVLKHKGEGGSTLVTWRVVDPAPLTVKIDDKNLEIASGDQEEIQKVDLSQIPSAMKNMAMLATWLKMDADELTRDYKVTKLSESQFSFEPRDESLFTGLDMSLNPKGYVRTLVIREKSGDSLSIEFSAPKPVKAQ